MIEYIAAEEFASRMPKRKSRVISCQKRRAGIVPTVNEIGLAKTGQENLRKLSSGATFDWVGLSRRMIVSKYPNVSKMTILPRGEFPVFSGASRVFALSVLVGLNPVEIVFQNVY